MRCCAFGLAQTGADDKGTKDFVMYDKNNIRIHKARIRELEDALRDILLACRDKAAPEETRFETIEYTASAARSSRTM